LFGEILAAGGLVGRMAEGGFVKRGLSWFGLAHKFRRVELLKLKKGCRF